MSNETVYNAACKRENLTIGIPGELSKCTKDLLVNYKKNGQQINAFLTQDGMIRESSIETECNEFQTMMKLNDKFNIIRKYKNIVIDPIIQNKTNHVKLDIFKNIVEEKNKFSTLEKIENFSANYNEMHGLLKFTRDFINIIMLLLSSYFTIKLFKKCKKERIFRLLDTFFKEKKIFSYFDETNKNFEKFDKKIIENQKNLEKMDKFFEKYKKELDNNNQNFRKISEHIFKPSAPPQEVFTLEKNLKDNMKTNTFFESNICKYCDRKFGTGRGLATHLRIKKNKDEKHKSY